MIGARGAGATSGVVEGFYGTPWSFEERAAWVELLAEVGLGELVVAPKDDAIHRKDWRRPLTRHEADEWAALFDRGARRGVTVRFGVHPQTGIGVDLLLRDRAAMRRAMAARARELHDLGARGFAIGFDDTLATLFPRMLTEARGRWHGDLCDAVRDACADACVVLVPARYFGDPASLGRIAGAYYRGVADRPVAIPSVWTGRDVLSRWISGTEVRRLAAQTGLPTVVWDNEVANDWLPLLTGDRVRPGRGARVLSFGPVQALATDVPRSAFGVWLNAACEPWLTRVSVRTLGDFVADPSRYDRRASHRAALVAEFGEAAPAMAALHDLASYRRKAFRHRPIGAEGDFAASAALSTELTRTLAGHPVLDEVKPLLLRLELAARTREPGVSAGEARRAARAIGEIRTVPFDEDVRKRGR